MFNSEYTKCKSRLAEVMYYRSLEKLCGIYKLMIHYIEVRGSDHTAHRCLQQVLLYVDGILPKRPYPPCIRMADRALLAEYPRCVMECVSFELGIHYLTEMALRHNVILESQCCAQKCGIVQTLYITDTPFESQNFIYWYIYEKLYIMNTQTDDNSLIPGCLWLLAFVLNNTLIL